MSTTQTPLGCGVFIAGRPPIVIEILLWIHCRASEWEGNTAFFRDVAEEFCAMGVAEYCEIGSGYRLTERGRAWVAAVCRTPVPVVAYVGENGEVIKPY